MPAKTNPSTKPTKLSTYAYLPTNQPINHPLDLPETMFRFRGIIVITSHGAAPPTIKEADEVEECALVLVELGGFWWFWWVLVGFVGGFGGFGGQLVPKLGKTIYSQVDKDIFGKALNHQLIEHAGVLSG